MATDRANVANVRQPRKQLRPRRQIEQISFSMRSISSFTCPSTLPDQPCFMVCQRFINKMCPFARLYRTSITLCTTRQSTSQNSFSPLHPYTHRTQRLVWVPWCNSRNRASQHPTEVASWQRRVRQIASRIARQKMPLNNISSCLMCRSVLRNAIYQVRLALSILYSFYGFTTSTALLQNFPSSYSIYC